MPSPLLSHMGRFCAQNWNKAQEARVKCAAAWAKAGSMEYNAKLALLKEYLVLLFHTVMPPDVRRGTPTPPRHVPSHCCVLVGSASE